MGATLRVYDPGLAKPTPEELWKPILTGDFPHVQRMRRVWGVLPSPPRCKLCNAQLHGPGGILMGRLPTGPRL